MVKTYIISIFIASIINQRIVILRKRYCSVSSTIVYTKDFNALRTEEGFAPLAVASYNILCVIDLVTNIPLLLQIMAKESFINFEFMEKAKQDSIVSRESPETKGSMLCKVIRLIFKHVAYPGQR